MQRFFVQRAFFFQPDQGIAEVFFLVLQLLGFLDRLFVFLFLLLAFALRPELVDELYLFFGLGAIGLKLCRVLVVIAGQCTETALQPLVLVVRGPGKLAVFFDIGIGRAFDPVAIVDQRRPAAVYVQRS